MSLARKNAEAQVQDIPDPPLHIDIAEVQTAEGKRRLFVAIDCTSKFAFVELHEQAGKMIAARLLRNLVAAVPCTIRTVLTDNGIQFTNRTCDTYAFHHIFDRRCDENHIGHHLIRMKHPWTNGQVGRMNRAVKRYHPDSHDQLRQHLDDFVVACNFERRLKTSKGSRPMRPSARHGRTANPLYIRPAPGSAGTKQLVACAP